MGEIKRAVKVCLAEASCAAVSSFSEALRCASFESPSDVYQSVIRSDSCKSRRGFWQDRILSPVEYEWWSVSFAFKKSLLNKEGALHLSLFLVICDLSLQGKLSQDTLCKLHNSLIERAAYRFTHFAPFITPPRPRVDLTRITTTLGQRSAVVKSVLFNALQIESSLIIRF